MNTLHTGARIGTEPRRPARPACRGGQGRRRRQGGRRRGQRCRPTEPSNPQGTASWLKSDAMTDATRASGEPLARAARPGADAQLRLMTDSTSLSHRRVGEVEQAVAGVGSERLWHATANTPAQILGTLLDALASESAWSAGPATGVAEATITHGLRPLGDAGWKNTVDGRWISWDAPGEEPAGVHVDAFAAGMRPDSPLPTWTMWGAAATPHASPPGHSNSLRVLRRRSCTTSLSNSPKGKLSDANIQRLLAGTRSPPSSSPPSPSSPILTR